MEFRKRGVGDPMPGGMDAPIVRVSYPRPGKPLEGVIVSATWVQIATHWDTSSGGRSARTVVCHHPEPCVHCEGNQPQKWHAYVGFQLFQFTIPMIVSLTKKGATSLARASGDPESFRGITLILKRTTDHPNSPILAEPSPKRWLQRLPDDFDLLPSLRAIYGDEAIDAWERRNKRKDGGA